MLYNGQRRWKAATRNRALVALSPDSTLWPWQPHGRYYLCDMGAFPQEELAGRSSLVALLFRLERQHAPEELTELLDQVIRWFRQHEGYERLKRLFTELIREALARHRVNLARSGNSLEMNSMKSMLTIDFKGSRQRGLAEGVAQGVAKGKADALMSLLEGKFGAVALSRRKRIRGARLVTLERWFKRGIVAPDLRSVFNPPR